MGWDSSNFWATMGSYLIGISVLVFLFNVFYTRRRGKVAGNDPWDARTLEWTIPSPPPEYNFREIPVVEHRDDFWYRKHPELIHHGGDAEPTDMQAHRRISGASDVSPEHATAEHSQAAA